MSVISKDMPAQIPSVDHLRRGSTSWICPGSSHRLKSGSPPPRAAAADITVTGFHGLWEAHKHPDFQAILNSTELWVPKRSSPRSGSPS